MLTRLLMAKPKQQHLPFRTSDWNDIGKPGPPKPNPTLPGSAPANPNLHDVQFKLQRSHRWGGQSTPHTLVAVNRHSSEVMGSLSWHKNTGEIEMVQTPEHARGRGIAHAMWHTAHAMAQASRPSPQIQGQQQLFTTPKAERFVPPRHSAYRTDEGNRWAHQVGGHIPPWQRVNLYGGAED